ncbi:thioredoxin (plasmid) [Halorussus limi]|uniref:Thioredoxin n=1 Tax=Halorussus limi TaxID=2938695 RepID=A0A8U0I030_9EURY|nr:thioredoxin [Halorussus limi]UPV76383.1 thioredoxin [Halorussus limi]
MSEDKLESIRERKRDDLLGAQNEEGDGTGVTPESDASAESEPAPTEPVHVESVEQFSDVTTRYDVTLVDFYADWCGPCNMLEPTVEAIARDTDAAVAKVDIDEHQGLAAQYGVRSVPTLLLFADGEQVEQIVGVQDEATLTKLVERHG